MIGAYECDEHRRRRYAQCRHPGTCRRSAVIFSALSKLTFGIRVRVKDMSSTRRSLACSLFCRDAGELMRVLGTQSGEFVSDAVKALAELPASRRTLARELGRQRTRADDIGP